MLKMSIIKVCQRISKHIIMKIYLNHKSKGFRYSKRILAFLQVYTENTI